MGRHRVIATHLAGTLARSSLNLAKPDVRIYLVRHGETEWSLSGRHTGSTDIPLTPAGEDEARDLVPWLRTVRFAGVLASPMQRAKRTCELSEAVGPCSVSEDLREWNYGDYEGRRSLDIHNARPDWDLFRDGCPGGEAVVDVAARADRLIAHLRTMTGNIALFSHGQFGSALAVRWIGLPVSAGRHLPLHTASLNVLGCAPDGHRQPVIALWNALPACLGIDPRRDHVEDNDNDASTHAARALATDA